MAINRVRWVPYVQNFILPTALWRGQRGFCFPREKTDGSRCHYKAAAERQADPARTHSQLVLFSQHLEGWPCLSLCFTGLEGLSQKSCLGNHGEDKERPAQGHSLPILPQFHRQVTPSNNAYKEFWSRPLFNDISRFPGHLRSLHLSFLCYMFSNMTNKKDWSGLSISSAYTFFLVHRMILQEEMGGF